MLEPTLLGSGEMHFFPRVQIVAPHACQCSVPLYLLREGEGD